MIISGYFLKWLIKLAIDYLSSEDEWHRGRCGLVTMGSLRLTHCNYMTTHQLVSRQYAFKCTACVRKDMVYISSSAVLWPLVLETQTKYETEKKSWTFSMLLMKHNLSPIGCFPYVSAEFQFLAHGTEKIWSCRVSSVIIFHSRHPTSYPMGTGGSFPGGKAAGTWSWPLTSS
jgi:hypothetical protein